MSKSGKGTTYTISIQSSQRKEGDGGEVTRTDEYTVLVLRDGERQGSIKLTLETSDASDAAALRRIQEFAEHLRKVV